MSVAGGLALDRRFWWALPIVALAIALLVTRETLADRTATLRAERVAWTAEVERADRVKLETERRYADNLAQAVINYADRASAMQPIIVRSINTVREYAQTDAGRGDCFPAERVRGIREDRAAVFAATANGAGGGAEALPAGAAQKP